MIIGEVVHMTRTDEPEQTRKRPADDGEVSPQVEQTHAEAADAATGPVPAASASRSDDIPRDAPDETSRPIDTAEIADWMENEARVSYSGHEPIEIDRLVLLQPGEKKEPITMPVPRPDTGRPVGAVSGGPTRRRMPGRTAIGIAITGVAIGVAAVWARSQEHGEPRPASQAMPSASSLREPAQTGAPVAPLPRNIEERSAGVAPAPPSDEEAVSSTSDARPPAASAEARSHETMPRHPPKQSIEGRATPPIGNAKTMGKLYLVSRSSDVIVQFQGRSQRVPSVMTLPVGKQTIRVKRGNHESVDLPIEVVSGRTTTVALD